jgi:hypothetical protein
LRLWFGMNAHFACLWGFASMAEWPVFKHPSFVFVSFLFLRGFLCVKVNEESQRNKLKFVSSILCVWRLSSVLVVI